jgi:conserved oligomeric Golgi complex subunit 6
MRQHVAAANLENAPVLEEASTLLEQQHDIEAKKQLLNAFNKHFIISDDELELLTSTSEPVNDTFFEVLSRVKQIHTDCQILLGNENQRLGLDLMEQQSRNLTSAYQKLYKWIQREFESLNLENPHISSLIRRSLRALAERPTLFQSCLDLFAEARERVLTDAFYSALTGPSANYERNLLTKPIEFFAHDPLRYVGDMLAWAHSTTVSEREALESLFVSEGDEIAKGIRAGRQSEPWLGIENEPFDGQDALCSLVNRNLSGVGRALSQRIEQVIQNLEDQVLIFKVVSILNFYRATFSKLLGAGSSVLELLSSLEGLALRQFQTLAKERVTSFQAELDTPPQTLRIPGFLDEALIQLKALLTSHDSSLCIAPNREAEFQPILAAILTPCIESCEKLAQTIKIPASSIFLTNCLLAATMVLSPFDFVTTQISNLDLSLEAHISTLISYQHAFFLHTSGLHPLVVALAPFSSPEPPHTSLFTILTLSAFQPDALRAASQKLDEFLPTALMDATENLKYLSSVKLAAEITAHAAERFCEDFEFVEDLLVAVDRLKPEAEERDEEDSEKGEEGDEEDSEKGEEGDEEDSEKGEKGEKGEEGEQMSLRALFTRTTGEIRVLLS